mmetsp:Transcript_47708/g.137371  ORF Transcript_47708/g.137371 Transcript_47708/m.137371 type:complete len:180 (+) Transcript_47708:86-625(+)
MDTAHGAPSTGWRQQERHAGSAPWQTAHLYMVDPATAMRYLNANPAQRIRWPDEELDAMSAASDEAHNDRRPPHQLIEWPEEYLRDLSDTSSEYDASTCSTFIDCNTVVDYVTSSESESEAETETASLPFHSIDGDSQHQDEASGLQPFPEPEIEEGARVAELDPQPLGRGASASITAL